MNYLSNEVIAEFFMPLGENEASTSTTTKVNVQDPVVSSPDSATTPSEPTEASLREKYLQQRRDYKLDINQGFHAVNSRIPFLPEKNVPQIKTLRLSIGYIRHLERILADEMITDKNGVRRLLKIEDFKDYVQNEMKRTDDYAGKAQEAIQMEQDMLTPPAKKPRLMTNAENSSPPVFTTPSPVHWTPASVPQLFNFPSQFNPSVAIPFLTPQTTPSPVEQKLCINTTTGNNISPPAFKTPSPDHRTASVPQAFNLSQPNHSVTNPFITPPPSPPSFAEYNPRVMDNSGSISPPVFNNPFLAHWTAAFHQWFNFWSQFNSLMAQSFMPNLFVTPPQTPQTPPPPADKPPSQHDSSLVFMNL